jgi:hypothetical protein
MFKYLHAFIQASPDPAQMFTSNLRAVYDWMRLGLFTGSRLASANMANHI